MAAKRTSKVPSPKFQLGDLVRIPGKPVFGEVSRVYAYDAHLGDHRYKVLEDGTRRTWNGKGLVLVRAAKTEPPKEASSSFAKIQKLTETQKLRYREARGAGLDHADAYACAAAKKTTPRHWPPRVNMFVLLKHPESLCRVEAPASGAKLTPSRGPARSPVAKQRFWQRPATLVISALGRPAPKESVPRARITVSASGAHAPIVKSLWDGHLGILSGTVSRATGSVGATPVTRFASHH